MKCHFPDPDTGYYDDEERFYELDAQHEAEEERKYLEELEASRGCGFDGRPITVSKDQREELDPETGCTLAEMDEEKVFWAHSMGASKTKQDCERMDAVASGKVA